MCDQTSSNEMGKTGSISYSDNIQSEDYISQFLDFKTHMDIHHECGGHQGNKGKCSEVIMDKSEHSELKSEDEESHSEEKCRSSFHNFQKHLVTTLRKCFSPGQMQVTAGQDGPEKILWDFFMNCPKMTRTLIYLVFGGMSLECSKVKKFNKKYGLEKLLKPYPQSAVRKAQKNIRLRTLQQLQKINIEWEINQRRMRDKEGFRIYF